MPTPRLIIAASEQCPDMLYATRFSAPDPFLFLEKNGRRTIVLNDLEIDRGRAQACADEIVSYSDIAKRLPKLLASSFTEVAVRFLKERKVRAALVPASFPLGLAIEIEKAGIRLRPQPGLFWKDREFKTEAELNKMRRALAITERRRLLVDIGPTASYAMAAVTELASAATLGLFPAWLTTTRDQVGLVDVDNVVSAAAEAEGRTLAGLGIVAASVDAMAPTYLWRFRKTGQYEPSRFA